MKIRKPLILDWMRMFYRFATAAPEKRDNGSLNYGDLYMRIFLTIMVFLLMGLFVLMIVGGGLLAFLPIVLIFGIPYVITESVHQFRG